jgi:NAD(P)-dependent dehydrogenase (short-subunit alcohol dehydrogenase family)
MVTIEEGVVVIAGGAGFLGRHFAHSVAESGGVAVLADIDASAATIAAGQIADRYPGRAVAAELDITSADSINALIGNLQAQHGRIDAIVNNAYPRNRNYGRKLEDVAFDDFCENVDMHLGGYFLVAQRFAMHFRSQNRGGNIINVSSIYGVMPPRFDVYAGTEMTMPVEYAAVKSAIVHLTRYFAQYFKHEGIRVNCISPGGILDGQPEPFLHSYKGYCGQKGMLDPQDVCGCLLFLLSDASRYMTGRNLVVDDGFSL